jgi:Acyclic terpene utilisation family protein AtuA
VPDPVRIANFSGFYGDRRGAARELLDGPDRIDVLTGDYLAELTMLILWKAQQKDPSAGYATTFLDELSGILADCLDRGVKIVANAGGLNPRGLAARVGDLAARLGVEPKVAVVEGDDIRDRIDDLVARGVTFDHLDTGQPLRAAPAKPVTANAYLGGWGIAAALSHGADIVVTGRVTDASLVVGPAAWWHGWGRESYDEVAGAVVAGHIIECGPQATGGNYSFAEELPNLRYPGFPIAEVAADGSSVITKQPGTGGMVSPGTVTAQLLYELDSPAYANPDVVARFDTIRLETVGADRVAVTGVRGGPPPDQLKVAINYPGGYRNAMTMVITGLDVERKAAQAKAMLAEVLGGTEQFEDLSIQLIEAVRPDAASNAEATSLLRVTVRDQDPAKVGRRFSNAVVALSLASYSGFYTTTPPQPESAYGVYWPALVPASEVRHSVLLPDGRTVDIPPTPGQPWSEPAQEGDVGATSEAAAGGTTSAGGGNAATVGTGYAGVPLGRVCGARSGDKGGNANVGIWALTDEAFEWMSGYLTAARFQELLGAEAEKLDVRRYLLPNLRAIDFVVVGLLGAGVASSSRYDPQAKGLGEYVRSRIVPVPIHLLS